MSRIALRRLLACGLAWLAIVASNGQTTSANAAPARSPDVEIHVVQAGETLDSIAAAYHVTALRLAEVNNITDPSEISTGDRLIIPHTVSFDDTGSGLPVVVGLGDSLDALAAEYQTTPHDIALANRVVRADLILAGQTLIIPQAAAGSAAGHVARLSAAMPLWRIALAVQSNMVTVALSNHLDRISGLDADSLIVMQGTDHHFTALASPWVSVALNAPPLEAGRTGSVVISVDSPGTLAGTFLKHDLRFVGTGTDFSAIFGIERWTQPGEYPISITFTDAAGKVSTIERSVIVTHGNYASEIVTLPEDAAAARSDPQVVADELAYLTQKMSGFTPQRYWTGMFRLPTAGVLTSAFGSVRSINGGGYNSYHTGNDLAATTGTPIYAPADGVIVDTGLLEVRGYSTIIDHGTGVYTGYWHQAGILVHPGDKVTAGQQIGVVGDTGSSTASHLHWEMWVGGIPVDALQWVREVFP